MNVNEIFEGYTAGKYTPEKANALLKEAGSNVFLDPNKNALYAHEVINRTAGLMDTGTGTLDKVYLDGDTILNGFNEGSGHALVWVAGECFNVEGNKLVK